MSIPPLKTALVVTGVSGAGFGSYGVYYFTSHRETIGEKLVSSLKGTKKRFLGKSDAEWPKLQDKYNSLSNKPKKEDGSADLPFSDLPNWCDKNYHEKYSDSKKDLYDKVSVFCFFNTNTVLAELEGKTLISGNRDDIKWQTSWDSYNTTKTQKGLGIVVSDSSSKLNGGDKVEGAKALYDWCNSTSKKKMYSIDIDTLFPRFEAWCISK